MRGIDRPEPRHS